MRIKGGDLQRIYRRIAHACADILFPLFCVGCDVEGKILCDKCLMNVRFVSVCACPLCGTKSSSGLLCGVCEGSFYLDGVVGCFDYGQKIIAELIKLWKYHGISAAGLQIGKLIEMCCTQETWISAWGREGVLVPVPLHKRKFCERGFNQAEFIARCFGKVFSVPVFECLERAVYTDAQAQKTGASRRVLSDKLFRVKKRCDIKIKRVILIDDVYTTGTTLNRVAEMLKNAGVERVYGLVYARET